MVITKVAWVIKSPRGGIGGSGPNLKKIRFNDGPHARLGRVYCVLTGLDGLSAIKEFNYLMRFADRMPCSF